MPNLVLASTIAVHFPSPSPAICMYLRPYKLVLVSLDAIGRGLSGPPSVGSKGLAGVFSVGPDGFRTTRLMRLKPEPQ